MSGYIVVRMVLIVSLVDMFYVEFYSKNKFEKLVHLVGFFIRIYHEARFSEFQTVRKLLESWSGGGDVRLRFIGLLMFNWT